MANPQRGEAELVIGSQTLTLCLTLGALAEIEALCRPGDTLTAETLLRVIHALARGGGCAIGLAELKALPVKLDDAAEAVAACLGSGLEP